MYIFNQIRTRQQNHINLCFFSRLQFFFKNENKTRHFRESFIDRASRLYELIDKSIIHVHVCIRLYLKQDLQKENFWYTYYR